MLVFTHVMFGILFGLLAKPYVAGDAIIYFTFVIIGSILPDIDHEGSLINKVLPITKWFSRLFRHRGFFHTIFPALILFFVVGYFSTTLVAISLVIGYLAHLVSDGLTLAHLVSDGLTLAGVDLLHPISQFKLQGFIKTGGVWETVTCVIVGIACLLLIF